MKIHFQNGFTLIELMITVAIVGILASVAYPTYTSYIVKGKRAEARTALTELLQQQERYMTQNNCYVRFSTSATGATTPLAPVPATACGGVTPGTAPFKAFSGLNLNTSSYMLTATNCLDNAGAAISIQECVQLIATPRQTDSGGAPIDQEAKNITLTSTGTRSCTGTKPTVCWK
jgi:type IV pilus assembly protein PilE